jgi:hypothetical protein
MELQATALPELNGMLEQKAEMAVHISLSDFTEEPQRAKTFLHMMRFVLKEQGSVSPSCSWCCREKGKSDLEM